MTMTQSSLRSLTTKTRIHGLLLEPCNDFWVSGRQVRGDHGRGGRGRDLWTPAEFATFVEALGHHAQVSPGKAPVIPADENWVCSYIYRNDKINTAAEEAKYRIGEFCFSIYRCLLSCFHALGWFENVPFPM